MEKAAEGKQGTTKERWLRGVAEKPFDAIRDLKLTETKAEDLWNVLKVGTISTNIFLRRLHNFAVDMNWLLAPIIPRRLSPKTGERLQSQPILRFEPENTSESNSFHINDEIIFQTMAGFGASFLDAGLICLNTLPPGEQEHALRCFSIRYRELISLP